MDSPHICHAIGCDSPCPLERLFCKPHWKMTPKDLQGDVWKSYVPGQCTNHKKVTKSWLSAVAKAKAYIAVAEGLWDQDKAVRYLKKYEHYLNKQK